ncbi:MAG: SprB repeat-containing protein [Saprospiraceae bacterium]
MTWEHNLCGDTNNGAIQVTANSGSGQYSYLWNNGQTDNSISNLSAGIYCVTVTDVVSACTAQDCVIINTTPAIAFMVKTHHVPKLLWSF